MRVMSLSVKVTYDPNANAGCVWFSELDPGEKLVDIPIDFHGLTAIASFTRQGRLVFLEALDFKRQFPGLAEDPPA